MIQFKKNRKGGHIEMIINRVNTNNLTDNNIQDLYLANNLIIEKYNFLKRFRNVSEYKDLFLSAFVGSDNELFIIENASLICGILSFVKSTDWNGKARYKLTIHLCDLIIGKSLISCLSEFIDKKLMQHCEFAITTYNNELIDLITKYSYNVHLKGNIYTLKKEDIDINLLNKSIGEYQEKNRNIHMVYADVIKEDHIEQYCNLFVKTAEDMPDEKEDGYVRYIITPEKQRQINESNAKRNITHHCYMAFNSKNEMIAKTNLSVNNSDTRFPYQFMIGVTREYRGKSLGKWLYAAMYKKLFESTEFEKTMVVHHPENKSSISISKWVGYKFNYLEVTYLINK